MEKNITGMLAIAGLLLSQSAFSAPVMDRWGTGVHIVTRSCSDSACATVNFPNHLQLDDKDEYHSTHSQGYAGVVEFYGAEGYANLEHTGEIALPHLRGMSYAESSRYSFAGAYGLEGFTYHGADQTINLNMTLTGTLFNPANNPNGASISSNVYLFRDAEAFESVVAPGIVNINTLLSGIERTSTHLQLPSYEEFQWGGQHPYMMNPDDYPLAEDSDTLSIDLTEGDTFYLYAYHSVRASGQGGTYCPYGDCYDPDEILNPFARSLNSLELGFTTTSGGTITGLTASSVSAVPVPAAVWFMGSALLGLFGFGRRQKS